MARLLPHLAKILRPDVIAILVLAIWLPLSLAAEEGAEDEQSKQEQEIENGGATGKILISINDSFQALSPVFKSYFMTFMAFCFIMQWHLVPVVWPGVSPSKFWRQIGLNTLVFQIYYAPQFGMLKGKNFVASIAFIFFDTVVIFYAFYTMRGGAQVDDAADRELCADNWYKDISRQFRHCVLCFFAQSGLVMYYVFELNSDPKTHDENAVSMMEWVVALLIIEIAGDDEMGSSYDAKYWNTLDTALPNAKKHWQFVVWGIPMPVWMEFKIRQMMDTIINGMFRTMILGTAPIMLAVEDHMDFVKDCTALFFILKLDDIEPLDLLCTDNLNDIKDRAKEFGRSPLKYLPYVGDWVKSKGEEAIGAPYEYEDLLTSDLLAASEEVQGAKARRLPLLETEGA